MDHTFVIRGKILKKKKKPWDGVNLKIKVFSQKNYCIKKDVNDMLPFLRFFYRSVSWTSPTRQSRCSNPSRKTSEHVGSVKKKKKMILISGPYFYRTDTCDPAALCFKPAFLTWALIQRHLPSQRLEPLSSLGDLTLDSNSYPLHLNSSSIPDSLLLICPSLL